MASETSAAAAITRRDIETKTVALAWKDNGFRELSDEDLEKVAGGISIPVGPSIAQVFLAAGLIEIGRIVPIVDEVLFGKQLPPVG